MFCHGDGGQETHTFLLPILNVRNKLVLSLAEKQSIYQKYPSQPQNISLTYWAAVRSDLLSQCQRGPWSSQLVFLITQINTDHILHRYMYIYR